MNNPYRLPQNPNASPDFLLKNKKTLLAMVQILFIFASGCSSIIFWFLAVFTFTFGERSLSPTGPGIWYGKSSRVGLRANRAGSWSSVGERKRFQTPGTGLAAVVAGLAFILPGIKIV